MAGDPAAHLSVGGAAATGGRSCGADTKRARSIGSAPVRLCNPPAARTPYPFESSPATITSRTKPTTTMR
jgi:hypothetical protein